MFHTLRDKYLRTDQRSKLAIKNIGLSLILKVANILSSFLIVPLTINYINPTQYGIWLTLSGIIAWINFFDFGLGNGLRNKYAETKAKGDETLVSQYVSTAYASISGIVCIIYILSLIVNHYINWSSILHVDMLYNNELQQVFFIVCSFICLNMIVNLFGTILTADQRPGLTALINSTGQYLSLLVIYVLTLYTKGSLTNLALYFSGIPCFVMLLASIYCFCFTKYKRYSPKLSFVRLSLLKDIFGLGFQFFIIYMCLILVFQFTNIVLSREIGPESVAEYNIASKYFNALYLVLIIIVTPFWSAFTDAYTKKDFNWMKETIKKLEKVWVVSVCFGAIMLLVASDFYSIWIGSSVSISFWLSFSIFLFTTISSIGNIYMYLINGIGTIRIQLIIYIIFAIITWPVLVYSCRLLGVCGIVIVPTVVYTVQSILAKIQLSKLINGNAVGIWGK